MQQLESEVDLPEVSNEDNFQKRLEDVINNACRENKSNTPDFILANYMLRCLQAFEDASNQREQWFGNKLTIGENS